MGTKSDLCPSGAALSVPDIASDTTNQDPSQPSQDNMTQPDEEPIFHDLPQMPEEPEEDQ